MSISVVFVIKNGIKQGYCFWESLQSCLSFADEVIISEGYSADDTYKYLEIFKEKHKKTPITLFREKWPEKSYVGEVIAEISESAIKKAKCQWIYLLQADEIIHEKLAEFIASIGSDLDYNSVCFPFYHFIREWQPCINPAYKEAIRMVRNNKLVKLKGDAWSFIGQEPIYEASLLPKPIYHFAWVFPEQNNAKDIEHFQLYQNVPEYREKMQKALLNKSQNPYPLTSFNDFPELSKRFIGKAKYVLPEGL